MKTSLEWVKSMVPGLNAGILEYMDAMTMSGTKAEGYMKMDQNLEGIVIGQIIKIEPHPDADKLIICQVDTGETGLVQIVTGAPNVKELDKVPVVLPGGRVAGGHDGSLQENGIPIKKGKLRGVESFGMLCSIEELGSTRELFPEAPENGIYIFSEDAVIGENAVRRLGLDDVIVEYEVTSNRVDCFSVIGIAREASATFKTQFVPPMPKNTGNNELIEDLVKITVEDPDLCSRYTARAVKNIKIGPSPDWMKRRLRSHGIRSINNLVDITNYVMLEYGQPMHAFDLSTIAGNEIIVKRAQEGEEFITLDGQTRKLDSSILMINDADKAVGIAGIMGGENSMITDDVKTVLLESACFDGSNIRLSAKKLGMRTDASSIFEKGLDPNNAIHAINRACQLVEELAAGEVIGGVIDIYPNIREEIEIPFEPAKYNRLLGTEISEEHMLEYFERAGLNYLQEDGNLLIPTFRQDLLCDADIAEEVARFYGYDKIPTTLPNGEATTGKLSFKLRVEAASREVAENYGFSQGMCYSFESPKVFDKLLIPADSKIRQAIEIMNPLGEDYSIMRTISLNGMLVSLATNYNRRNKDVRLYEMGNIYIANELPLTDLPDERMQLTFGMYGEGDFYTLKAVVEDVFLKNGLTERLTFDPGIKQSFLHPGRQGAILYNNIMTGYIGELHPSVAANYNIKERVYIAVLDMPVIIENASFDRKYKGIAKFPAATRDLSMVVPNSILAGEIEEIFESKGGSFLESFALFDLYEGSQIQEGYKSMAYTLTFRSKDKNLEESDIITAMNRILKALEAKDIELRK
ncbi:MAG: phenylalanine--tRNA ligase subunit beta [Lachnospiraceae bacterium]